VAYFPRSKDAKQKLVGIAPTEIRTVTLACGHETSNPPSVSNPDRWYHCGAYQKKTKGRTPR
jgi:hypothetical protein